MSQLVEVLYVGGLALLAMAMYQKYRRFRAAVTREVQQTTMTPFRQAHYNVEGYDDKVVILRDVGYDYSQMLTVTNDAERVCRQVSAAFPRRRIFYFDSDGDFAEMQYDATRDLVTFLPARSEDVLPTNW